MVGMFGDCELTRHCVRRRVFVDDYSDSSLGISVPPLRRSSGKMAVGGLAMPCCPNCNLQVHHGDEFCPHCMVYIAGRLDEKKRTSSKWPIWIALLRLTYGGAFATLLEVDAFPANARHISEAATHDYSYSKNPDLDFLLRIFFMPAQGIHLVCAGCTLERLTEVPFALLRTANLLISLRDH